MKSLGLCLSSRSIPSKQDGGPFSRSLLCLHGIHQHHHAWYDTQIHDNNMHKISISKISLFDQISLLVLFVKFYTNLYFSVQNSSLVFSLFSFVVCGFVFVFLRKSFSVEFTLYTRLVSNLEVTFLYLPSADITGVSYHRQVCLGFLFCFRFLWFSFFITLLILLMYCFSGFIVSMYYSHVSSLGNWLLEYYCVSSSFSLNLFTFPWT